MNALGRVFVIRLEMKVPAAIVNHPAAHLNGMRQNLVRQADSSQSIDPACGNGQIDRPAADEVTGRRIWTALIQVHFIAGTTQISCQQTTGQATANQGERRIFLLDHSSIGSRVAPGKTSNEAMVTRQISNL